MSNKKNSPDNTLPGFLSAEPANRNLLTGVLIGGLFGVVVGAVATVLAKVAGQVLRKVFLRGQDEKPLDPRWLLQ